MNLLVQQLKAAFPRATIEADSHDEYLYTDLAKIYMNDTRVAIRYHGIDDIDVGVGYPIGVKSHEEAINTIGRLFGTTPARVDFPLAYSHAMKIAYVNKAKMITVTPTEYIFVKYGQSISIICLRDGWTRGTQRINPYSAYALNFDSRAYGIELESYFAWLTQMQELYVRTYPSLSQTVPVRINKESVYVNGLRVATCPEIRIMDTYGILGALENRHAVKNLVAQLPQPIAEEIVPHLPDM